MKRPPTSKLLQLVMVLVALIIVGCESADIETGTTTSDGGSSADGTTPGTAKIVTTIGGTTTSGGVTYTSINFAPASALHTSTGDFTVLEISDPIVGYTYTWSISEPSLGKISPKQATKVTYTTSSIPSSGTKEQAITVTGMNTGSPTETKYKGTFTITHRAK